MNQSGSKHRCRVIVRALALARIPAVRAGRSARAVPATAALMVVVLAAAGCSGQHSPARHSATPTGHTRAIRVAAGHAASLRLADGWEVTIPAGSVTRSGTFSGTAISAPAPAPPGMALAGPVFDLSLAGPTLVGPVQLTVPVPAPRATGVLAGPDAALLVYYNPATSRWQPVTASYDPVARTLTATSQHLSIWSVLVLNASQVLAAVQNALTGFLGVADVAAPSCPGTAQLAGAGITVATADAGDLVKWCAGIAGPGSPLVQVADNRNYGMELDYPANWRLQRLGPPDPLFDQILTSLPTLSLQASGPGTRVITIAAGHTVELRPPLVDVDEATATVGVQSILINAILYGVETFALTDGFIARTLAIAGVNAAAAVAGAFKAKDCLTEFDALVHGPAPASPQADGVLFRNAADLATGCLDKVWPTLYHANGADAAFIATVLLWLIDGVKLILADLHAAIDTVMYARGYHILYASLPTHWARLGVLADRTASAIQSLAISPVSSTLVTGHIDGSSYLWNIASEREIATITQPVANSVFKGDQVESLAFSPDGVNLATGLGKGLIVLHNLATGQTTATFNDGYGQGAASSLAFSPDGKTLAAADLGGRGAFLWDIATGRKLALLSAGIGAVTSVAFSPDGRTLATGGDGGTVLWDVTTGHKIAIFGTSASGPIVSVAFSPDGSMLATGGFNGAVLWDIATKRRTATFADPATTSAADSVAFSPDGAILATAGTSTCLWNTATGAKIATIDITADSVAFNPDGQTLATAADNHVTLWAPA